MTIFFNHVVHTIMITFLMSYKRQTLSISLQKNMDVRCNSLVATDTHTINEISRSHPSGLININPRLYKKSITNPKKLYSLSEVTFEFD